MPTINLKEQDNKRVALIAAAQTLTGAWTDLGDEINCMDIQELSLWLNLDINDSTGVQFRVLGRGIDAVTWYDLPVQTVTAAKVTTTPYIEELTNNVDQKIIIPVTVADTVPIIKIQVLATVVGAAPGQLLTAHLCGQTSRYGL